MAKERQMVSVGWEGRASGCGAEVSGHHGTGPARAACGAEPTSSGGITLGDGSLRGAWRHRLSSGSGVGVMFRAWVWYHVGSCQKEHHQVAIEHGTCPLGIPRY